MHEQQSQPTQRLRAPDQTEALDSGEYREQEPGATPRIYVADLAAYNDGRLHGRWLDANQDPAELSEAIAGMLAGSPVPGAEEWAIHDHDGFAGIRLSEYESLESVSQLALGIAAYGPAFAALTELLGSDAANSEAFENYYRGSWATVAEYAEELLHDLGAFEALEQFPAWVQPYLRLDTDAFARDLQLAGDVYAAQDGEQVHIFDTHP